MITLRKNIIMFDRNHLLAIITFLISGVLYSQVQIGENINGNESQDRFGFSISLNDDGSRMAVGTLHGGYVKVYKRLGNEWEQLGNTLLAENPNTGFGFSLNLDALGNNLVVSAPYENINGDGSGAAFIFRYVNGKWQQIGNTILGKNSYDHAGRDVKISSDGSRIALGAFSTDVVTGGVSSHVRVYAFDENHWVQLGNDIDGQDPIDFFGIAIAINNDGSRFAAGATYNDDNGNSSGHVRVFEFDGANWIQLGETIAGDYSSARSGATVSFDDSANRLAIGAPGYNVEGAVGYVKVLDWKNNQWQQVGENIVSGDSGDLFGSRISIDASGNYLVAAACHGELYNHEVGYIRIFNLQQNEWIQIGEDIVGDNEEDRFGSPLSLSRDGQTIAGASHSNDNNGINTGHVKVYGVNSLEVIDNLK